MALIFIPVVGQIVGNDKSLSDKQIINLKLLESGDLKKLDGIQGKYISIMNYTLENPKKIDFFNDSNSNIYSDSIYKIWKRF